MMKASKSVTKSVINPDNSWRTMLRCREVLGPASPPPVSSDVVKNMLNQIEAFSTAMRRTWGEP